MPTTLTPPVALPRGCDLPSSDGVPLESTWHLKSMWLLIASIEQHWLGRTDFFVGGNQFFYFDPNQAKNNNFQGPDFYVVKGVSRFPLRRSWVTWEEGGRVPNVIVELLSPSTAENDRVDKRRVYLEQLDVREYYCFDPDGFVLEGWRKGRRRPVAIKPQGGRLWSEELELFLGSWEGVYLRDRETWLRFFDADGNLSPIAEEVAAERVAAATARAQVATDRAQAEADRANTAEAEVAKLRAELERLNNPPTA